MKICKTCLNNSSVFMKINVEGKRGKGKPKLR